MSTLVVPWTCWIMLGDKAFRVAAAIAWNTLWDWSVSEHHHRTSDHVDHTISRYRSRIHRAYDIVVAIYRTISCMNTSRACAAHAPQWQHLHLIDVTCRAHHPWLPLPDIRCGRPMMQHIGSMGWGLGDGSCTSGGLKYACRKAHCAHRTT